MEGFGPCGAQLTVATVAWTCETAGGLRCEVPAPTRVLNTRTKATELLRGAWIERVLLQRDPLAEGHERLWSLPEESRFGDFWAAQVPRLQKASWRIVVRAGFAHQSVPVERWKLVVDRAPDDDSARELAALPLPYQVLTDATPVRDRGKVVQRVQALEVPMRLLSLKAGGVGLNLTAADTVIHVDPWWNPAVERQASDRAHRIGQDKPVFVYKLVVEGSIEERMLALQAPLEPAG